MAVDQHPAAAVLTLVARREICFAVPFLDKTRAELVATLAEEGLHELACSTVSFVHCLLRERPHTQCGVCHACAFRPQTLSVAGIEEPAGSYNCDLFGAASVVRGVPAEKMEFLRVFLVQAAKLAELDNPVGVTPFFRGHLLGTRVVKSGESLASLCQAIPPPRPGEACPRCQRVRARLAVGKPARRRKCGGVMNDDIKSQLKKIDPRILGQRRTEPFIARGMTQEDMAEYLGRSRPTTLQWGKANVRLRPRRVLGWQPTSVAASMNSSGLVSQWLRRSPTCGRSRGK